MHLLYIIIKIFIISTLFNSLYRVGRKPNPHELMIIHMLKCVDSDPQAVLYVRIFFCPLVTLKKNVVAIEIAAFWCVSAGWNLLVVCWETVHVTGFCYLQCVDVSLHVLGCYIVWLVSILYNTIEDDNRTLLKSVWIAVHKRFYSFLTGKNMGWDLILSTRKLFHQKKCVLY